MQFVLKFTVEDGKATFAPEGDEEFNALGVKTHVELAEAVFTHALEIKRKFEAVVGSSNP